MCGIAGLIRIRESIPTGDQDYYRNVFASGLQQRGPDNTGFDCSDSHIFCHTRLAIQDIQSIEANQPYKTKNSILLYNGEIYNHHELRNKYLKNEKFCTTSDTETLALMLDKHGVKKTISLLNGIFAFSYYDKKEQKIYLARDHQGIKPLFYSIIRVGNRKELIFSSYCGVIARAASPYHQQKLDREGLINFFMLGAPFGEKTLFRDIRSVMPSTYLIFDLNSLESQKFSYETLKANEGKLPDLISQETLADCDTGILLSGGIDSSALTLMIEPDCIVHLDSEEKRYAKHIASLINKELLVVEQSQYSFESLYTEYASITGHCSASSPIPYMTAKAFAKTNLRVVFSANGADEIFYGYDRTPTNLSNTSALSQSLGQRQINKEHEKQSRHIFRSFDILKPKILGQKVVSPPPTFADFNLAPEAENWHYNRYELSTYDAWDLNITLDHAFMLESVEARVPFLNSDVINYAKSQPIEKHISPEYGRKALLKDILMEYSASNEIWDRPKMGFSLNKCIIADRRRLTNHIKQELINFIEVDLNFHTRDGIYLESAMHAFYYWKRVWIDSGLVCV